MRRLLMAMMVASSALYGTSMTLSSCTAGITTLSPCPGNFSLTTGLSGPNYFVSAIAAASDSTAPPPDALFGPPPPVPGGRTLFAIAGVSGSYSGGPPPPLPPLSAHADASASITAVTEGPPRTGFIQFGLDITSTHDDLGTNISMTDGIHSYGPGSGAPPFGCHFVSCFYTATLPFDLGTEFQVSASVMAGGSLSPQSGRLGFGQDGDAALSFRLLEPDGKTPVSFFVVPEPSTRVLLFIAFVSAAWFLRKGDRQP